MKLSEFDFDLPKEMIAQKPTATRDGSRLMIVDRENSSLLHDTFANIGRYLVDHPLMVFNDTRVLAAKLTGVRKDTGKYCEVVLVRELQTTVWEVLVKGLGKMSPGLEFLLCEGSVRALFQGQRNGRGIMKLEYSGELRPLLEKSARMPLPPYIQRPFGTDSKLHDMDRLRYQTVYAANEGAIAAPTAGLHFTPELLQEIQSEVADVAYLTLHVGAGTFTPIRAQNIEEHQMQAESFTVCRDTWNRLDRAKKTGQKILAVGTTTTRVLESLTIDTGMEKDVSGTTDEFIFPGREFRTVDQLLTNFHLPKSTLFLLVCAFAGTELMREAYQEAIRREYRFFSYGDAMLIL